MEPSVKVSIIIPCFNRVDRTAECWQALQETQLAAIPTETIFVNNGSTDDTAEFLQKLEANPAVVMIHNAENLGFSKANNQAAARAQGEFLIFLNNDTIPSKGWLEPLLELLANESKVGIAGSKLIYPDGRVQHAGIIVRERIEGKSQLVCDHIHRLSRHDAPWVNLEREYQAVTGACMAIRRETFRQLGGFDEKFFNGYEDIDLCFRAREAGLRVIYCPQSVVVHHESSSQGRFLKDDENTALFSRQWGGRIASDEKEMYAAAGRPNLDEMRSELVALRASLEKIQHSRENAADERGWKKLFRKPILRWLGIAKTQRNLASDIRAIRNTLVHLRRVTENMVMLLDHRDVGETAKRPTEDRADKFLQ